MQVNVNVVSRDLLEFSGLLVALLNGPGSGQLSSAKYDIGFGTITFSCRLWNRQVWQLSCQIARIKCLWKYQKESVIRESELKYQV